MSWFSKIVSAKAHHEQNDLALDVPLFLEQIRKDEPLSIERQVLEGDKLKAFVPLRNLNN